MTVAVAQPAAVATAVTTGWSRGWTVRTSLLVRSMLFWMAWFAGARALFFAWHWQLVPPAERGLVLRSFLPGMRMDASAAAYLTALAWLAIVLTVGAAPAITRRALRAITAGCILLASLVTLTDIGTFGPWRRRLDASIWTYLQTPREAYASASSVSVTPLVFMLVIVLVVTWWLHARAMRSAERALSPLTTRQAIGTGAALLVTGALLAIPIRGGIQWTPLNESSVAFAHSQMANLGAQNAGWYLLSSTIAQQKVPDHNPYVMLAPADAQATVDSLYHVSSTAAPSLLRVARPNVILIIWESFTAKVASRLGGRPGVTPAFDRWSHQGVLFDSVFASGERSAQGLVAILSAFPSVPNEAIMTRTRKAAALPQLGNSLRSAGYHTSYWYGGELAFANMKSYVLGGGFDRVTGVESFSRAERNSKWGAHDHVVLGRTLRELATEARPFFATVFTLSSHEPFEVPVPPAFPGADESSQFASAHHYTDASIGAFLDSAARQPWWDSTLVVIIADHGSPLPNPPAGTAESIVSRHHIPMLWVGGALRVRDTVVHDIGASVDLAPTLLAQLQLPRSNFRWGRDLLAAGSGGFAYFASNDGFAYIDRTGWLVFDERAHRTLERSAAAGATHVRSGGALLQATFDDYLAR